MERLQDPRWQRKRLVILERASWRCEWCGTENVNLQVHHGFYEREAMPWEYPDEALYCLCDHCHEKAEQMKARACRQLGFIPPWHQLHAVTLLCELQRLVMEGVVGDALQSLVVERVE